MIENNILQSCKSRFLLLLVPLMLSGELKGQANDTIQLGEVQIVSSLLDMRQRESGRSVSIITAEQLRQVPASTLDEIIRHIPGLEAQSRNLYGVQTDYSIRGSTFNQVLIMIDGVRLNDPLTGHFNGYIPIPLSEVNRIELIRGPATVMYGPDAVGGVINIITHNFSLQPDTGTDLTLSVGAGEHGLFYSDAALRKSYGNRQFGGGFRYVRSDGYPGEGGLRDDFSLGMATLSSSFMAGNRTRISLRTAMDARDFSARRFYTISPVDTAREKVQSWWNHAGLWHTGRKSVTTADLAFKTGSDHFRFNPQTPANEHTTNQWVLQARNNRNITGSLRLAAGFHANHRSVTSNDRGDHSELFGGIYSLAFISLPMDLNLSGGARIEFDRFNDAVFLPQLNLAWIKGPFTFRSLAGRTMRTPDFTERYISTNLPSLAPGRNLGNPFLRPEKSWSFEAGADMLLWENINLGFTAFTRVGKDLIDYVLTPAGDITGADNISDEGSYFYARNMEGINTRGVELIIQGNQYLFDFMRSEYNAGYTFQVPVNPGGELSKYLSNQAKHLFVYSSFLSFGRGGLGFSGIIKIRDGEFAESINVSLTPSYAVFNMQGRYSIVPERVFLEMRVENVLNTKYGDILGAMLPGRWFSFGLVFRRN